MTPTDITGRTTFWQEHVTAWQTSGLTQKAYCKEHDLRYSTFGYWARKLRALSGDYQASASGFIPVTLQSPAAGGLVLALPNGLEIRGIEANNLGLLRDLLGVLA